VPLHERGHLPIWHSSTWWFYKYNERGSSLRVRNDLAQGFHSYLGQVAGCPVETAARRNPSGSMITTRATRPCHGIKPRTAVSFVLRAR
jgi:hypothetical protein